MRTIGRLVVTATLIAIGLMVQAPAATAAAPTIEAPERVYTNVNTPLFFTVANDPVSLTSRLVKLSGDATSSSPCDPSLPSPEYTGCITAKFELFPNGNQTVVSDIGKIGVTLAGQARINTGTNNSTTFQVIGLLADVNATIATLKYTPGLEEDQPGVPFETRNPLLLKVTSINGDASGDQADRTIEIKVENSLDPPELTVPSGPLMVALPDDQYVYPDDGPGVGVDPITVEDPDVDQGENDDQMLLILYLDCGGAPGAGIELSMGGGIAAADLAGVIAEATSLPAAGTVAAVVAGISTATQALGVDVQTLSFGNGGPGTTAVAEISDLEGINDVLARIWFYPPAVETTCTLWYVVTDFGNNGMPFSYTGFEVPSLDPTDFVDVDSTTFEVKANGDPEALDDDYVTDKNTPLAVPTPGVLANDTDPDISDGDAIEVVSNTDPANGTLTGVNADGSFSYTPDLDFVGLDTFTVTIEDTFGAQATSTVRVNVVEPGVNSPPIATDDSYSTPHDTPLVVTAALGVLDNDTDVDLDPLTVTLDTDVTNGTLALNANGSFTYTPGLGHVGSDSFIYEVSDGNGGTDLGTVTIDVTNAAPVAGDDSYSTNVDTALVRSAVTGVLANDTDADGDPLTVTVDTDVANGTLALNANGSFTYTPNAGYVGPDSFKYEVSDDVNATDTATVSIEVLDPTVNSAPVANDDAYEARPATLLDVPAATGFLANDTDADGDTLNATVILDGVENGTLAAFPDGSFTYTSDAGFVGVDSFVYRITDGAGGTDQATVTINVINSAPVANDDEYDTRPGTPLNVPAAGFLTNDTDADSDPLVGQAILDGVDHGTLSAFPDGSFTYTPTAGFVGVDSFTYRMRDSFGATDQAVVTVNVVNNPPVANDDSYTTPEATTLNVPAAGFLTNDTDADSDPLVGLAILDGVDHGTLSAFPDGSFTYTPTAGFNGVDSFRYRMGDGFGGTAEATVRIAVGLNEPPMSSDDDYVVLQDTTLDIAAPGVLDNDTDPNGDALAVTMASPAVFGTLTTSPDGSFTYIPDPGAVGIETITITVSDGLAMDTSILTIEILARVAINVPPDITVPNDPGQAGAVVTYPAPTSAGGTPPVAIACTSASGVFYPIGTTTVTCTATDSTPDDDTDSFTITVIDAEPPTIADRPDISVTSTSPTPVSYEPPAASDNSGTPPTVVCVPASGSTFPLGATTVTCTATDGTGNTASSAFTVTVTAPLADPVPATTPPPPLGGQSPVTPPTPSGELPATGGGSPGLLRIGGVVLLLGAAVVLAARSSAAMSLRRRRLG